MELADFDKYLKKKGLLANSRRAYLGVILRAGDDPVEWYTELSAERPPEGTLQPARTAVAHWLRFLGKDEAEIRSLLPPARGRKSAERQGLSPKALSDYLAGAAQMNEPLHTLLLLLPRTGLRISELCNLRFGDVREHEGHLILAFRGKGDKPRVVPLGNEGAEVLREWLDAPDQRRRSHNPQAPLFPGRSPEHGITSWPVQEACRVLREEYPSLRGLTPHILRHTYATRAVVAGVDLASLKALLGHENLATTQRYLHPTVDNLTTAVAGIKGL